MNAQDVARKALVDKARLQRRIPGLLSRVAGRPVAASPIPEGLAYSPLFIWERDICRIAIRKNEKFVGSRLLDRMTRYEPAYWTFNGFKVPYKDRLISSCWLLPEPGTGLLCVFFYHEQGGADVAWATKSSCTIGGPIPAQLSSIIAMREFLNLRLAANDPVILPRIERRLLAKHNTQVPEIRLISLREKESSSWHSVAARRYRNRWITSGHWRRLNEPLKKDSKRSGGKAGDEVVWVVPHEKGPEGAPLLPQRESVYVVAR